MVYLMGLSIVQTVRPIASNGKMITVVNNALEMIWKRALMV